MLLKFSILRVCVSPVIFFLNGMWHCVAVGQRPADSKQWAAPGTAGWGQRTSDTDIDWTATQVTSQGINSAPGLFTLTECQDYCKHGFQWPILWWGPRTPTVQFWGVLGH